MVDELRLLHVCSPSLFPMLQANACSGGSGATSFYLDSCPRVSTRSMSAPFRLICIRFLSPDPCPDLLPESCSRGPPGSGRFEPEGSSRTRCLQAPLGLALRGPLGLMPVIPYLRSSAPFWSALCILNLGLRMCALLQVRLSPNFDIGPVDLVWPT